MSFRIHFEGLLRSPASWAKVNRKILTALVARDDVTVAVQPRRGFLWDREFPLPDELADRPEHFEDPDVKLAFPFPPKIKRVKTPGVPLVVHSLYEASRLPESWIDPLRTGPDRVLVPSEHVRRVYRRHDIPGDKLKMVPYGYDPECFYPDNREAEAADSLRIVTIATPHFRKGLDLFRSMVDIPRNGEVEWRIHSPLRADDNPEEFWVDPWVQEDLEEMGFEVTTGSLEETELAEALRSADLCVQPSRSEGFGLVALEAMASGTAVLTTDWGGHLTFAGPGMIKVDGSLRGAGRCQYHQRRPAARVFEPDPVRFRSRLRALLADRNRLRSLGERARTTVDEMTWDRTASRLIDVLRNEFN